jgi:hypothetical protein
MSLLTFLKDAGKDLKDVEGWIIEGGELGAAITGVAYPPVAPIMAIVEKILASVPQGTKMTSDNLKSLVTAAAMTHPAVCCCSCPCCMSKS